MNSPYEDIIDLPHYVSKKRKRMSKAERAAQFSPFAALTGYEASIREAQRVTDDRVQLDVDGIAMLNEQFRRLSEVQGQHPEIRVTYFVPDLRKHGGRYLEYRGKVRKVDAYKKTIVLEDGMALDFQCIREMEGNIFFDL